MMRKMKKWFSGFLCLTLLLGLLPTAAWAAEDAGTLPDETDLAALSESEDVDSASYDDNTVVTRAILAELIYQNETLQGVIGTNTSAFGFSDISGLSQEQQDAINAMANARFISGIGLDTSGDPLFSPSTEVTRADAAVIFWKLTGSKQVPLDTLSFTDVFATDWYAPAVAAMASARQGAKTVIIQERSVFGGNASSEMRMHISGASCHWGKKDAAETGILMELQLENKYLNDSYNYSIWDGVLWHAAKKTERLDIFLNTAMYAVDSDGQDEVIVINAIGSGTGVSVDELHVVEKGPDGTLTDNCFPASLWQNDLSDLLSAASAGGRTYAILGTELVDITADTAYADLETLQYGTGSIANFSASPPAGESGGVLSFRGAFLIAWEGHPSGAYVADITADISYKNGTFTLSEFHLDSNQSTRKE